MTHRKMHGGPATTVVVFDVEFTAWEGSLARGWNAPGEHRELVQIGAVKLDPHRLKPLDEFMMLVRPRINPVLSDYLVALTGITQDRLHRFGVDFVVAYRAFLAFVGVSPTFAVGRDDLIFRENMRLYGWSGVLPEMVYCNVVPWLQAQGLNTKGRHACDVAALAGAPFAGRAHDGLQDAHSVVLGLRTLVARGAPNPFLVDHDDGSGGFA